MVSRETKQKTINMMVLASMLFLAGTLSVKLLSEQTIAWFALLLSLGIFFFSGIVYIAAFLSILDDRKNFIKTVKEDFRHVYKKTRLKYKNCR
ncbi:MAG: DUF423 domain-containing protein [Candidatus Aenigmarchaeota archaeon]|nr:DUF423 domain-containing protein [Candidatus Aenigmarchaeota archaeon]